MKNKFRIRKARKEDKPKVRELFIHSLANRKNIFHPSMVESDYVNEFVNKTIDQGDMILVENHENELEMIGEVHYYYNRTPTDNDGISKEITFFSKIGRTKPDHDVDLVDWLYSEIEKKHTDVFSVEIIAPVSNVASVDAYRKKGIRVESNYTGRLKDGKSNFSTLLPLAWVNPSFN
jgi:hypothetical protein